MYTASRSFTRSSDFETVKLFSTVQRKCIQANFARTGRSYSTRTVLATQGGVAIFTITCSFCLPEPNQVTRQFNVPSFPLLPSGAHGPGKIPEPEDCLPTEDRLWKALDGNTALSEKFRE